MRRDANPGGRQKPSKAKRTKQVLQKGPQGLIRLMPSLKSILVTAAIAIIAVEIWTRLIRPVVFRQRQS
jgi:hypothetical protein